MDGDYLQSLASGYAPVVSGRSPMVMTGMEGLPGLNQPGMTGLAAQMFLAPLLQSTMQSYGYTPMGLGHDINRYDIMRHQQFTADRLAAMQSATSLDTAGYEDTFRGLAAVTGTPFGARQRRAARNLAQATSMFSPTLAGVMPEFMDELGGSTGSAVVMAGRLAEANRYRLDPITGQMGFSQDSVTAQTRDLFQGMYRSGDLGSMRGITAGQAGTMYDELNRRGMIGGYSGSVNDMARQAITSMNREDPGKLSGIASQQNVNLPKNLNDLGIDDLDKLKLDPAVADKIRNFDAGKVKRSLKSYIEAVSAMRDIFGDMGRPDAPMSELIKNLEVMSQGGLSQLEPGKLNMLVRTTNELAKQSGVSIDGAMMLQQHAAARAQALGISPLHATEAMQGNLAWSSAFAAQGGNSVAAWDRMDANQMRQLDVNLRVHAAGSEQAHKLAVLARVSKTVGGFEKGSAAEAITDAITSGRTEYMDPVTGQMRSTLITSSELTGMLVGAKSARGEDLQITPGTVAELLAQRRDNEPHIKEYNIGGQVRRQQPAEIQQWLSGRYREAMTARLTAAGMDSEEAMTVARKASDNVASRTLAISHEDFASDGIRTDKIGGIMQEELQRSGADKFFRDNNLGQDFFRLSAGTAYGKINRDITNGELKGFQSYQNLQASNNEAVFEQASKNETQADFSVQIATSLSGLSKGSALQRAVDYLQGAGNDPSKASIGELIAKAMGGEASAELQDKLSGPLLEIKNTRESLEKLRTKYGQAAPGAARDDIVRKFKEENAQLKKLADDLISTGERHGITNDKQRFVSVEESREAINNIGDMRENTFDVMASLSPSFSAVSDAEAKKLKGGKFTNIAAAREAILARSTAAYDKGITQKQIDQLKASNPAQFVTDDDARNFLSQNNRARLERQFAVETGQAKRDKGETYTTELFTDVATEAWMSSNRIDSLDEAKSHAIHDRDAVAFRATRDDIREKAAKENIPETEAEQKLNKELRMRKFAISDAEYAAAKKSLGKGTHSETDIQLAVMRERGAMQYDVTSEDIAAYRKENKFAGKVKDETIVKTIRQSRSAEQKERSDAFMQSINGRAITQKIDSGLNTAEDIADRVLQSKDMRRKVGPAGFASAKNIMDTQRKLLALATTNAGGDMTRLYLGDYDNVLDPEQHRKLDKEVQELDAAMVTDLAAINKLSGGDKPGWGDLKAVARSMLGYSADQDLSSAETAKLNAKVKELQTPSKLGVDDIKNLEDFTTADSNIKQTADHLGVSVKELLHYTDTGKVAFGLFNGQEAFTPLTAAQEELTDKTYNAWIKDYKELEGTRESIRVLEQRKKEKGLSPEMQKTIQEQIDKLKATEKQQTTATNKLSNPINALAHSHGFTEMDYLTRYKEGKVVTPATLERATAQAKAYREAEAKLPKGVTAKTADATSKTLSEVDASQAKLAEESDPRVNELLKSAFGSAGLSGDSYRNEIEASGAAATDRGQRLLQHINIGVSSLDKLAKVRAKDAESRANWSFFSSSKEKASQEQKDLESSPMIAAGELIDHYHKAQKDNKLGAFRKSVGLDGKANDVAFERFKHDADVLTRSGIAQIDDIDVSKRGDRLKDMLSDISQGVGFVQGGSPGRSGDVGTSQILEISGRLTVTGEHGDLNASPALR